MRKILLKIQKYVKILCVVVTVFQPSTASANWLDSLFGYRSFDECILDKMQGVTSDQAARSIAFACKNITKSDELEMSSSNKETCPKLLTSEQKRGVSGQSTIRNQTNIYMDLYNASRNHKISHVEVSITGQSADTVFVRELILRGATNILPLSTGVVMGDLGLGSLSGVSVRIIAVYGCEA